MFALSSSFSLKHWNISWELSIRWRIGRRSSSRSRLRRVTQITLLNRNLRIISSCSHWDFFIRCLFWKRLVCQICKISLAHLWFVWRWWSTSSLRRRWPTSSLRRGRSIIKFVHFLFKIFSILEIAF